MADEATAGDDQQTDDNQKAGEDQQREETPDERDERIAQLEQEVERANAFAKTVQNQLHDQQQKPVEETSDEELIAQGYTPEQIKEVRRISGTDKLEKEIAELKKAREEEQLQRQEERFQQQLDALRKEFPTSEGYPPVNRQELLAHGQQIGTINPRLAYMDKHEAVIYDKKVEASKPKAAVSDRSDSHESPKISDDEFEKKLWELRDQPQKRSEFLMKHGAVVPPKNA